MAEIFEQIHRDIKNSHISTNQQLTEYALFVCQQIPNIKKSYQQNLSSQLSAWMQIVGDSIQNTLKSKQTNQIGPKLELIYTTVVNQQQNVNQRIKAIAEVILKENYCFLSQNDGKFKQTGMKYTETSLNLRKEETGFINRESSSFYNSGQKTILKGRSLSNGSQRRKLSKVSCFAQAKKVEGQNDNFLKTASATQAFCKASTGNKIKKAKKKEENGFSYLEKCMSSTSPSNFMLGYMAKAEYRKQHQAARDHRIDQKYKESRVMNDKSIQNVKNQLELPLNDQGHCRNDSGTYEKMMISFQEKIGQKLDELMSKYSKIQQKLQQQQVQSPSKKIKSQPQYSISVQAPQIAKQNQSLKKTTADQNNSSEAIPLQNKVSFVQREVKKVSKQKQNDKQIFHAKASISNLNKSLLPKNKIVRNRVEQPVAEEQSLESITLPKTSLKSLKLQETKNKQLSMLSLGKIPLLQSKPSTQAQIDTSSLVKKQQTRKIEDEHDYIVKQIIEFNKTTQKVILPISKKLLFIIKKRYQAFCNKHQLQPKDQIGNIQTEEVKNEGAELKDSLQKMQKILQLKCNEQKKQKLLFYVCVFLQCYLSFGDQNTILKISCDVMNEQTAINKIKESISKLK